LGGGVAPRAFSWSRPWVLTSPSPMRSHDRLHIPVVSRTSAVMNTGSKSRKDSRSYVHTGWHVTITTRIHYRWRKIACFMLNWLRFPSPCTPVNPVFHTLCTRHVYTCNRTHTRVRALWVTIYLTYVCGVPPDVFAVKVRMYIISTATLRRLVCCAGDEGDEWKRRRFYIGLYEIPIYKRIRIVRYLLKDNTLRRIHYHHHWRTDAEILDCAEILFIYYYYYFFFPYNYYYIVNVSNRFCLHLHVFKTCFR
jgi:hypothetical protein